MRTQIPVVVIVINFSPEVKLPPTPFSWILSRLAHHSPFPRFLHHFIRHLILLRLEGNTKTNPSHATNVTNVTFLQTTPTGSGGGGVAVCATLDFPDNYQIQPGGVTRDQSVPPTPSLLHLTSYICPGSDTFWRISTDIKPNANDS